jgi:cardiolipin synthase A/B
VTVDAPADAELHRLRRGLEAQIGIPATEGNRVDVLRNGAEVFPAMLDAIRGAERSVDLLAFQLGTGEVVQDMVDALADQAAAGRRVRVVLDAVGSRKLDSGQVGRLRSAGADVEYFRPPTDRRFWQQENRTHRKVLVVDQRIGFAGGVNISEQWEGDARNPDDWRDTHLRIQGPAVDGLQAAFSTDWIGAGRPACDREDDFPQQPQPGSSCVQVIRGEPSKSWSDIANAFASLLTLAHHRVRIASAYFAPDPHFTKLLCEASSRGVDVEVLVPGPNAHSRFVQLAAEAQFQKLMDAGVRIWSYLPTMIHAKIVLVDDVVACVGSANFDRRSMKLNHELEVIVMDRDVVAELDRHYDEDVARSERIVERRWANRSIPQRAAELVVRPFRGRL